MTTTQRLSADTLLGGRYRLVEPLPGTGRSWRARDEIDGRTLLARVVALPESGREQARERALRDAAVVARAQHPGVAQVVDAVVEDGRPWVISVLPAGRTLGELVRGSGRVPPAAVALIGLQVLDALVAVGIPHGDLTPDDVVVGADGRVVVTGLGTTPADGTGFGADLWALGAALHVAAEGRVPDGDPPFHAGALTPALAALLDRAPDPDAVRRLLADAAGEPDRLVTAAPAPELHDPDVAAALAAFDATVTTAPAPGPAAVPHPRPPTEAPGRTTEAQAEAAARVPAPRSPEPTTEVPAPQVPAPAPRVPAPAPRVSGPAQASAPPVASASAPTPPESRAPAPRTETRAPATRTAPAPARLAEPDEHRRLLGGGLAIVAALAVVAALLLPHLLHRGSQDAPAGAQPAAQPTATTPSPDSPIPPPAGFQLYRDPAGWSIAVPDGWTTTRRGTAVTFAKADRTLRVTERADPPKDTYDAAAKRQPAIEAATPGYDLVRFATVSYRAWPTTDFEYRGGTAVRTHSLIRSTVPNPRQAFDISWTCLDRTWTADKRFFDAAVRSFDPGA